LIVLVRVENELTHGPVWQAQNRELKMLLNQYLTSKVNGQLYVPPTATISRVDE
jgi:hypothetical protein